MWCVGVTAQSHSARLRATCGKAEQKFTFFKFLWKSTRLPSRALGLPGPRRGSNGGRLGSVEHCPANSAGSARRGRWAMSNRRPRHQGYPVSLSDISAALLREQALLEMLLFKLEEEHLLLAAGRTRWLAAATREVEAVLSEIRRCELVRATLVAAEAPGLGLSVNPSLRELAEAAPEPWDYLFAQHRTSFLEIADEISAQASANKQLLARGAAATRDLLDRAARERTAGRPGARSSENSFLVDQSL